MSGFFFIWLKEVHSQACYLCLKTRTLLTIIIWWPFCSYVVSGGLKPPDTVEEHDGRSVNMVIEPGE